MANDIETDSLLVDKQIAKQVEERELAVLNKLREFEIDSNTIAQSLQSSEETE